MLWPEDSVSNYLDNLTNVLDQYKQFFEENTAAFIVGDATVNNANKMSLTMLRTQLQTTFIKLVDAQHEINYAALYHQFSHKTISEITQHVKALYTPLHGIGLSVICKNKHDASEEDELKGRVFFVEANSKQATQELIKICVEVLNEFERWVSNYKEPSYSLWSTFIWPFPRITSHRYSLPLPAICLENLDNAISRQIEASKYTEVNRTDMTIMLEDGQQQQLLHLFQFNLVGYAKSLHSLVCFVEQLKNLESKKIWLPRVSFRHWLKSSSSDSATIIGGQITNRSLSESSTNNDEDDFINKDSELGLNDTPNQEEQQSDDGGDDFYTCTANRNSKTCPRDPDFDKPSLPVEHFFSCISGIFDWIYSRETLFALKTATGFILLSLPAYLPQSVGWFTGWGGQWVANALIMWIFPMAGMFNFT